MSFNDTFFSTNLRKIFSGLVFLLFGLVLLLENFNLIPEFYKHYIFSWESVILIFGIFLILGKSGRFIGSILIFFSLFSYFSNYYNLNISLSKLFFPALLILIGLSIIFKRSRNNRKSLNSSYKGVLGYVDETVIFSSSEILYTEPVFKGGNITLIFGECKLDLTRTSLPEGTTTLDVSAIFGGLEITVPENWKVVNKVTGVFGAFVDKRYNKLTNNNIYELIITGTAIFGGGELRSR
jgi:predicted membrane protein